MVRRPGSARNNTISCLDDSGNIRNIEKKKFFNPSLESGVNNSISCLDDSISCCAFQNNKDLLTMVNSGGKLKTDSFGWVLMGVYYQIEIPYPVSHLKSGKNWLWMNLRTTKSKFHFMLCNSRMENKTGNETNNWIVWLWNALKKCRSIWPLHWLIGWVEKNRTNVQCAEPSLEPVGHFETASTEVQLVLTMVSFGGKLKTDSFVWVLMRVYYQIEIPYPVSHSKSGKKLIWMNLKFHFLLCIST